MATGLDYGSNIGFFLYYECTSIGYSEIVRCNYFSYLSAIVERSTLNFNTYTLEVNFNSKENKPLSSDPWWFRHESFNSSRKDFIGIKIPCWIRFRCVNYLDQNILIAFYSIPFDSIMSGGC